MAVNTTLAWLIIISALPIAGALLYALFGEHRLGGKRIKLGSRIRDHYQNAYEISEYDVPVSSMKHTPFFADLSNVVSRESGFFPSTGNTITLFDEAGHIINSIIDDINASEIYCFLEFYIIQAEGRITQVMEALESAAQRGVDCRILADDIGSRVFLKSPWRDRLEAAGVQVNRSLAVNVLKSFSKRTDLRNHRKLIIIDQRIGYIGSYNLVDPVFFKQDADVGQWVDIMARVEGHAVASMAVIFNTDYIFDAVDGDYTKEILRQFPNPPTPKNFERNTVLQLIPSGPEMRTSLIYEVIVSALFGARESIQIVTPYFVPDEAIVLALRNAARRGIDITLILPKRIDSIMARYASESVYGPLLEAGVTIRRFENGLLHTKAILIDKSVSFIGTVNMDMRSFYLNLEVTMAVYDTDFAERLHDSIDHYISRSEQLDLERWNKRSRSNRLKENLLRLATPLL